jgi:hypothetical protein
MNNEGTKLICIRDIQIKPCVTIYNTPKGLTSKEFKKESEKYPKWWETKRSNITFSKGDIVEFVSYGLPGDYEIFTIKIVKSKVNPVKTEDFMFEYHGFDKENEEVFISLNEDSIQYFCDINKLPDKKETDLDLICKNSDKIATKYDISRIEKLDENIYKLSANILYGSDKADYFEKMNKDIMVGVKSFFEDYFKNDILVHEITYLGIRMNPDRVAITIIIFVSELIKENLKNGAKQLLSPDIKLENCKGEYSYTTNDEENKFDKRLNKNIRIIQQQIIDFL